MRHSKYLLRLQIGGRSWLLQAFLLHGIFCTLFSRAEPLILGSPEVVSQTRVGRTVFEYTMRATVTNTGALAAVVRAEFTSGSPHTVVTQGVLNFGDVGAAATVESLDMFTIRHDRSFAFDPAALHGTIKQPFVVSGHTPATAAGDVGVTVRPQVVFSKAVDPATLNATNFYASVSGQKLPATIVPSKDGTFAWLFLKDPMPGSTMVQVTVDGSDIRLLGSDDRLDAAGQGVAGSTLTYGFSTVSVATIPGTVLSGIIVDPGADLIPFTLDDFDAGPDELLYTPDDIYLLPIPGVKVSIVGSEDQGVYTDANGRFRFDAVPAGDVKISINGRTAPSPPDGYYFPEMVMDARMQVGATNWIMTQMESVYLARVSTSVLQTVMATNQTLITLSPKAAYHLPAEQQQFLTVEIPPNSLIGMDGLPLASAQIGVSVVPPGIVRDMLPLGLLQHTFDITVQALGVATFSAPARMTFPNVFGAAAPPGSKLNFLSFDHTTGRLVIDGTATVSADGLSVATDPGTGVTHPGWHGLTPPGDRPQGGGGGPSAPAPKPPKDKCDTYHSLAISAYAQCAAGLIVDALPLSNTMGCVVGGALGLLGIGADCNIDPKGCTKTMVGVNLAATGVGCIPFVGPASDVLFGCLYQCTAAELALYDCRQGRTPAGVPRPAGTPDPTQIPHLVFAEQTALWSAASVLEDVVYGSPKWCAVNASGDLTKIQSIFTAIHVAFDDASPGGARITAEERAAIHLLPMTSQGDPADLDKMLDRIDGMAAGTVQFSTDELAMIVAAAEQLSAVASELQGRGWVTTTDAFTRGIDELAQGQDQAVEAEGGVTSGPLYYRLVNVPTGFIQRGYLTAGSQLDQLFLPPNTRFVIDYFDPQSTRIGVTTFVTGPSGSTATVPRSLLIADDGPDTDGDGLSDEAEAILGINPLKASTAGDGISDAAKVLQGLDPLSMTLFPTGVIAALPLPGEARGIVIEGSTAEGTRQTAYMAMGSGGLAVVDVSQYQKPLLLGRLSLPGDATAVSVDDNLKIAVVAANDGGLHFVDVSDPMLPRLLRTIRAEASQVQVVEGVAYVAVGRHLNSYDVFTGGLQDSLVPGARNLTGLVRDGSFLYSMDADFTLRVVDINGLGMMARGSLALPAGAGMLFVGGGIGYVAALLPRDGGIPNGGFETVDVTDPDRPRLIANSSATATSASPTPILSASGSGLVLVAVSDRGVPPAVQLFDVADPAKTGVFLTSYPLPSAASAVAIAEGIAFVADGNAGLQIVNFIATDNHGVAPKVTINTAGLDLDPVAPGIQIAEGSLVPIQVQVSDDVQVRNVELLVNGSVVRNDVTFPFDLIAAMPTLATGPGNLAVQVRATDTGGNTSLSPSIPFQLVQSSTPTTVVSITPANGAVQALFSRSVRIFFSAAMDPSTLTADALVLTGPAGVVVPINLQLRGAGTVGEITYAPLAAGNYQFQINVAALRDRAGRPLGIAPVASTFAIQPVTTVWTAIWTNQLGGFWDVPTNWLSGAVPGPDDDVYIDVPGGAEVTFRGGSSFIRSLLSHNPLTLAGGTFDVSTTMEVDAALLMLNGSTLSSATVLPGTGAASFSLQEISGTESLDGVVLATDLLLPRQGHLYVYDGLTLAQGRLLVNGTVEFEGSQFLEGNGELVLGGGRLSASTDDTHHLAATLTIGSGVYVHCDTNFPGAQSLVNDVLLQGTLTVDVADASIHIGGQFRNEGTISATAGTLGVDSAGLGFDGSAGTLAVSGTGTVQLGGQGSQATFKLPLLGSRVETGGSIQIGGILDLRGDTLNLSSSGAAWGFNGGTIIGGTITTTPGAVLAVLSNPGTLDGVTLAGTVQVSENSGLNVLDGLTLNQGRLLLDGGATFNGTQKLSGNGEVSFGGQHGQGSIQAYGDGSVAGAAVLTIDPGILIHGTGVARIMSERAGLVQYGIPDYDSVVNNGTIQSDSAGAIITLDGNFTNHGIVSAGPGNLNWNNPSPNLGVVQAAAGGTVTVNGDFINAATGSMTLELIGPGSGLAGRFVIRGAATLDGTLNVSAVGGFAPALGDQFQIMTFSSRTGQFANLTGLTLDDGKHLSPVYGPTDLTLRVIP